MSLAERLDRLRGRPSAAAASPQGAAVTARLERLRPHEPAAAGASPSLADALGAVRASEGVAVFEHRVTLSPGGGAGDDLAMLPETHALRDADWVYLDTETTGLSGGVGNLAFMVGVARYAGDGTLCVRRYLLERFAAEPRMLEQVLDEVTADAVLVSYNGKRFDLPLLDARCRLQRLGRGLGGLRHLDLLYTVRRAYRAAWPDCRLQTAERRLLEVQRRDDLPGAEAPAAWQAWLRRAEVGALAGVLRHNLQDLVSLALLHRRLCRDYADAGTTIDSEAVGLAWERAGRVDRARAVWEAAGDSLSESGRLHLARLYRRVGDWDAAEAVWLRLQAAGSADASLELAKFYEHHRRDLGAALRCSRLCVAAERVRRGERLRDKLTATTQLPLLGEPLAVANAMK